MLLLFVKIPTT